MESNSFLQNFLENSVRQVLSGRAENSFMMQKNMSNQVAKYSILNLMAQQVSNFDFSSVINSRFSDDTGYNFVTNL